VRLALPGLFEEAGDLVDNFIVWRGRLLHRLPLIDMHMIALSDFTAVDFGTGQALTSFSSLCVWNATMK
jgi:hypothetical protein